MQKKVGLNALCFADDLILLCKADVKAFQSLLEGFNNFAEATGLVLNKWKSCLYTCGVSEYVQNNLLEMAGVVKGKFSMKYLDVPLKPTKWNKLDCACVVDKIKKLVICWGSRHLSFAGPAQLISSILFVIRSYWMSIFCLHQSVIR